MIKDFMRFCVFSCHLERSCVNAHRNVVFVDVSL